MDSQSNHARRNTFIDSAKMPACDEHVPDDALREAIINGAVGPTIVEMVRDLGLAI